MKKLSVIVFLLLISVTAGFALDIQAIEAKSGSYGTAIKSYLLKPNLLNSPKDVFYGLKEIPFKLSISIPNDFKDASGVKNTLSSQFINILDALEKYSRHKFPAKKHREVMAQIELLRKSLCDYILIYRGFSQMEMDDSERREAYEYAETLATGYRNVLNTLEKYFE